MTNLTPEPNLEFKQIYTDITKQFSNNSPIILFIKNNPNLFKKNDTILFKNFSPNLFQTTSSFAFSAVLATLISTQHPFIIFSFLMPFSYVSSQYISKFYSHYNYSKQRVVLMKYFVSDNKIHDFFKKYKEILLSSLLMIVKNNNNNKNLLNSSHNNQVNQTILYTYHKWKNEGFTHSVLADIYLNILNHKLEKDILNILKNKTPSELYNFSQTYKIFLINELKSK